MNRPICVLAIIYIGIIIGLHLNGVVFLDFDKVNHFINDIAEFEGVIIEEKQEGDYKYEYIIKIKSKNKTISNKKFILLTTKKNSKKLCYGDKVRFKGTYIKPSGQRNYGGFDYSLYLKTKKIYGTFETDNVIVLSSGNINKIDKFVYDTRNYIKQIIYEKLDKDESALCVGLVIGDKTDISKEIQASFRDSSLTHMLAISGAHFSYIILIMTNINKVIKRKRLGQILMIIVIVLFIKITGSTASVMRAGITAIMMIIASLCHKRSDSWNNMAISLIVQVLYNPYIIFDIGLILSYGGVTGILLFYKVINDKLIGGIKNKIILKVIQIISITISANIVIIPIMMMNFNTISFSFIISNLIASSLLGVIIIFSIILVVLSLFLHTIINPFWQLLNFFLKILLIITNICSNLPLSVIYVCTPKIVLVVVFYIILLIKRKSRKKCVTIILIIVILLNFIAPVIMSKRRNLEINFIDVGQGDSTLIRVNNKSILIDGGGNSEPDKFDIGEKVLFPYLLDKGIYCLDYIIISHFDSDHFRTDW